MTHALPTGRLGVREALIRTRTRYISIIRALLRQQGYRVSSGSAEGFGDRSCGPSQGSGRALAEERESERGHRDRVQLRGRVILGRGAVVVTGCPSRRPFDNYSIVL
jgi:hypothetical protein